MTLLPALVDAHVHTQLIDVAALSAGGISAVWDLGGELTAVRGFGPVVARYAGPFLIAPGGYPSDRSWAPAGSWLVVDDPGDAVSGLAAAGVSLIKVTAHAGGPMLPPATLAALVAAAHSHSLPVVVHAEGPGTVEAALSAGADMLAHTPWTALLDDGVVRACADAGMTWISTLAIHGASSLSIAVDNLRRFLSHGGRVRYGTDLGNGPQPLGVNPRELRALQSAGLSPAEVLATMTDPDHPGRTVVPGGLDLSPAGFAGSLATAQIP